MSEFKLDERKVQIIEVLQKKTSCSLEEIAQLVGVSPRTIRNDINQLNKDLIDLALITNERGKGYRLDIKENDPFHNLINRRSSENENLDTSKQRIAFIINCLINSEETYTLDDLAYEMHLGRTTIINELKKASVSLGTYNLVIQGKQNKGMQLIGEEHDKRFFILDNMFDLLYGNYPIDVDILEEVVEICNKYDFESTTKTRLLEFIIVMLDRLLKNHSLKKLNEKHEKLLGTKDYELAVEIIKVLESKLPINIPELEILFITIPIAGRRTPTNNRSLAEVKITEDVKRLLEQIIEQLGFKKEIIHEHHSFFIDLQYHLTFMLNRLLFGLRLKNPLLGDVKEKYPVAYKMAEIAGQVIEIQSGLVVSEDELGYLAFYFGVFIANNDVKVKRFRKAAVICGTGRGTAKLIAMQLERVLNNKTELDLFSDNEVTEDLISNYDIAFSTVKLPFEPSIPLVKISEIFDERKVNKEIEVATFMKNLKINNEGEYQSILRGLITEEKFFILDSGKGYHKGVETMIEALIVQGYLDEGFKERMEEREKKGSMIFGNYIAFPHTINKNSNSVELALGVFPEKINVEGKEVKVIFLLALPENQIDNSEHFIVRLYDEILKIANNTELTHQLANVDNYHALAQLLEKAVRM
ncbi:BglG family transcription antiterminator [Robertmurraya sp. FSL R5-0851]|uniref:BglG family transcription antiterminator n=1 Tax=Robertmurraya sp. FSL R5-0851 TaxID=2921584 RepID=UPI0030F9F981